MAINNDTQIGFDFDAAELTHDEHTILRLLQRGRDNAISMTGLAAALSMSTRDLQFIIKHLREDHGMLIASSTGKNHGYYYPVTVEEHEAGIKQIEHRIISLARLLRSQNRAAYEKIFGQGVLEAK